MDSSKSDEDQKNVSSVFDAKHEIGKPLTSPIARHQYACYRTPADQVWGADEHFFYSLPDHGEYNENRERLTNKSKPDCASQSDTEDVTNMAVKDTSSVGLRDEKADRTCSIDLRNAKTSESTLDEEYKTNHGENNTSFVGLHDKHGKGNSSDASKKYENSDFTGYDDIPAFGDLPSVLVLTNAFGEEFLTKAMFKQMQINIMKHLETKRKEIVSLSPNAETGATKLEHSASNTKKPSVYKAHLQHTDENKPIEQNAKQITRQGIDRSQEVETKNSSFKQDLQHQASNNLPKLTPVKGFTNTEKRGSERSLTANINVVDHVREKVENKVESLDLNISHNDTMRLSNNKNKNKLPLEDRLKRLQKECHQDEEHVLTEPKSISDVRTTDTDVSKDKVITTTIEKRNITSQVTVKTQIKHKTSGESEKFKLNRTDGDTNDNDLPTAMQFFKEAAKSINDHILKGHVMPENVTTTTRPQTTTTQTHQLAVKTRNKIEKSRLQKEPSKSSEKIRVNKNNGLEKQLECTTGRPEDE